MESSPWGRWLYRRVPFLSWRRTYSRDDAVADLVAGLTLGLTLVPQSIAYAALADLPVQYGLYSAFIGTILYVFLGTVKEVSIGPTSLMALMTLQTCRGLPIEFVVLLAFVSGFLVLVMGLLRLGFLVEFISPSVTSGFTSGTAVLIVVSQIKGLLGLSFVAETVAENLVLITEHIPEVRAPDCILAAVCCSTLLALRKLKDVRVGPKRLKLKKALWLISIARNAIVVCVASTVAYCITDPENPIFNLSGRVEPGLPTLSLPPFSVTVNNTTLTFTEMVQKMSPGVFLLPIIMVLANTAIAKAFTAGRRVDATQEMLTLGLCNMAGSLFHAMPTCGAFTRSAVSHSSGVRTPAAGLYSGIITLMALKFMTQYFYFIPKACLSSVLICAVIFMIDYEILGKLWRKSKSELTVLVITFLVSVIFTVEMALLVGAITSLVVFLRRVMHPQINSQYDKVGSEEVLLISCAPVFVYMNAEILAEKLYKICNKTKQPVLIDCSNIALVDYTAAQVMEQLVKKLKDKDQKIILFNATAEALNHFENINGISKKALKTSTVAEAISIDEKAMILDETTNLLRKDKRKGLCTMVVNLFH